MSAGVREWNLFDLCRLCLEREKLLVSVFETDDLQAKISSCLQVEILRTDEVTHKICDDCLNKVDSFYEFWNRTSQSQKELEKWLTQAKEEEKNIQVLHDKSESQNDELKDHLKTEDESIMSIDEESIRDEDRAEEEEEEEQQEEEEEEEDYEGEYENEEDVSGEEEIRENGSDPIAEARPEPTTFVNVPIESEEPGPSGIEPLESDSLTVPEERGVGDCTGDVSKIIGQTDGNLSCSYCSLEFNNQVALKEHVKESHSMFMCKCGAKFTRSRYLARHEARHNAKPTVPCKLCSKLFINNSEMKEHQKSHRVGEKITCQLCSYETLYKSNMSRHLKRHNKVYTVFCDECSEGCFSKDELATHRIKKHGATPFYCTICSKGFSSRGYLYEHNKTTHWITTKDYLCETCGKAFKTKTATKRHMKIHLGLKFRCQICDKSVNSAYSLKKHLKAHSGEKNVVCYICGKAFVDNKYMAAHLRSHTGERPYSCKECGKKFTQATTLKVHTRYHTGERPYVCQTCGSGFVTNTLLTNHMKGHAKTPATV